MRRLAVVAVIWFTVAFRPSVVHTQVEEMTGRVRVAIDVSGSTGIRDPQRPAVRIEHRKEQGRVHMVRLEARCQQPVKRGRHRLRPGHDLDGDAVRLPHPHGRIGARPRRADEPTRVRVDERLRQRL